ncbi:hypothetical protein [Oceanobacillus alkalisoli]|uniref:hypothetical protein n=1 Tax=Oceanobacillus alkalisoli TaxID=2925113 RepID=UPI001EF00CEE|nr:hypothetical protein [Oceanobacillus alkalisoli]MCF3944127.1 hypothetical protein [Oceanobacillus alkalisoli]MCG5102536.1 hypothetical protein [Oceanobacillus alkalisoli]
MSHSREVLLHNLASLKKDGKVLDRNNKKISRLHRKMMDRTSSHLRLFFLLITLGPVFLLFFIESQRIPILDPILFGLLPNLIPGYSILLRLFILGLIILFFYSMFTLGKEDSFLRRLGFVEQRVVKTQSRFQQKIGELEDENNHIVNASNLGILPRKYRRSRAINKIYTYLENLQADTLPEAIRLYEIEEAQMRQARASAMLDSFAASDRRRAAEEQNRKLQSMERKVKEIQNSLPRRRY